MYQAALTFNKRDCLSVLKPYGILMADSYFLNAGDPIDPLAIETRSWISMFCKSQ